MSYQLQECNLINLDFKSIAEELIVLEKKKIRTKVVGKLSALIYVGSCVLKSITCM